MVRLCCRCDPTRRTLAIALALALLSDSHWERFAVAVAFAFAFAFASERRQLRRSGRPEPGLQCVGQRASVGAP